MTTEELGDGDPYYDLAFRIGARAEPIMRELGWGGVDELNIYDWADPEVVLFAEAYHFAGLDIPETALNGFIEFRD